MRRPCTFKQSDVTKAVKAVVAAGVQVAQVIVDKDGRIVVIVCEPGKAEADTGANEWDRI
jgi:predicted type IV restriction endonuclease